MVSLLVLLLAGPVDCEAFAARADQPVKVASRALAADEIAWAAPKVDAGAVKIGAFEYAGQGIEIRSDDPRFAEIEILPSGLERHPCGFRANGPGGWDAKIQGLASRTVSFTKLGAAPPQSTSPSSAMALQTGIAPTMPGWVLGPSWPVADPRGGRFFLGVMSPSGGGAESLIVAFADKKGPPPRELARLRMPLDDLTVTPEMHTGKLYLNLEARMPDGAWRRINLLMPDAVVSEIAGEFGLSKSAEH